MPVARWLHSAPTNWGTGQMWFEGSRRVTGRLFAAATLPLLSCSPLFAASIQDEPPLEARPIVIDAAFLLVPLRHDLTVADRAQVEQWVQDYTTWRKWAAEWRSRAEPGWFSRRDRRPRPDPPGWLVDTCSGSVDDEPWLAEPCTLVTDWQSDLMTAQLRDSQVAARTQKEAPTNTLWWQHIHVDALWPVMQSRGTAVGMFGTHLTIDLTGRLEVFGAPGFIMLTVPTDAGREWTPATDWGFAVKLGTFTLPGMSDRATLHVNVARAWILGTAASLFGGSVDLVGLSVTFPQSQSRQP